MQCCIFNHHHLDMLEGKLFIFNPDFQYILSKNNGVDCERPSNTIGKLLYLRFLTVISRSIEVSFALKIISLLIKN